MPATRRKKSSAPDDYTTDKDRPLFKEAEQKEKAVQETKVTIDYLKAHCMEVSLEVNWFTTSKAVDRSTAIDMLEGYEADADSVGMSKRLFSSKHPLVKSANEAKRALVAYRDSMTAVVPKSPPLGMDDEAARKLLEKEPGVRLIETEKIDEFEEHVAVLVSNLQAAIKALNAGLSQVLAFDKAKLGKLYKDSDYPEKVEAQVRGPKYGEIKYSLDFEKIAPKAFARMAKDLEYRLKGGIELTVADFADALISLAKQMANQLGSRIRLKVPKTNPAMGYLRDAEVVEYVTHAEDPEVPVGSVAVNLRYTPPGKKKNEMVWHEFTVAEYDALCPYESDEKKKLYESSLQNLRDQCDSIKNVMAMLGNIGTPVIAAADKVEDLLASVGGSNKEVLEELRNSNMARKATLRAFNDLASTLTTQVSSIEVFSERRRSISKLKRKSKPEDEE